MDTILILKLLNGDYPVPSYDIQYLTDEKSAEEDNTLFFKNLFFQIF